VSPAPAAGRRYREVRDAFFQAGRTTGRRPGLSEINALMLELGQPQRQYPIIHITGTNGKTSTALIISALLQGQGLSVATYSSPHLRRVNERMSCNSTAISDEDFSQYGLEVLNAANAAKIHPAFFDLTTAMAFRWFALQAIDVAVIEVGMLGRWDATNVADATVAVVTTVGADHLNFASSVDKVAREKAGIIKRGSHVVLGGMEPRHAQIFRAAADRTVWQKDQDFFWSLVDDGSLIMTTVNSTYRSLSCGLLGAYHLDNSVCALASAEAFIGGPLDEAKVREALRHVRSPGRMELVFSSPTCVLDGAHNAQAVAALVISARQEYGDGWIVVYGALDSHDWRASLAGLIPLGVVVIVASEPKASNVVLAQEVADEAARLGLTAIIEPVPEQATAKAVSLAGVGVKVLVTGSLYILEAARQGIAQAVNGDSSI
jgi:dihydrofolate synthase/folylpolyglutamate synthase